MGAPFNGRPSASSIFRSKQVLIPLAILLILFTFVYSPLPTAYDENRDAVLQNIATAAKGHFPVEEPAAAEEWRPTALENVQSKYAFATFLAGQPDDANEGAAIENNHYFVATRILAYQLLHAPETRSRTNETIPFIVLVTDNVPEEKRDRLRKDGAIVVPAKFIVSDWAKSDTSTWADVMTKLRLWELTQFERICFMDGDTVLVEPLDEVFVDPAVHQRHTLHKPKKILADEGPMPANYTFAGVPEMNREHHFPPTEEGNDFPNAGYLNAGFFVFQPSPLILDYYLSLMNTEDKFNPQLPEQNLLNYAHRRDGNMPWTQLGNMWNIHYPTVDDLLSGAKSLHEKWWAPVNEDLRPYMESWRWRMEGHYEARDKLLEKQYEILDAEIKANTVDEKVDADYA